MIFSISKQMIYFNEIKKILVYIGDNTLTILTWHFLSFKLVSLFLILIYQLPISRLAEFPVIEMYAYQGWWLIYFIVGVGMPIGGCKIIDVLLH